MRRVASSRRGKEGIAPRRCENSERLLVCSSISHYTEEVASALTRLRTSWSLANTSMSAMLLYRLTRIEVVVACVTVRRADGAVSARPRRR